MGWKLNYSDGCCHANNDAYVVMGCKKEKPLLSGSFNLSDLKKVDARLITGSILFGLGWGLSGICPGPGLVQLVSLKMEFLLFFAAVLGGMWLTKKLT